MKSKMEVFMSSDNYAAIDCGTNSTRLLIGNKLETFDRQMRITRLGQDVANGLAVNIGQPAFDAIVIVS